MTFVQGFEKKAAAKLPAHLHTKNMNPKLPGYSKNAVGAMLKRRIT